MITPRIPTTLRCPICSGEQFDEVLSRTDGRMVQGRHKTTLMVCTSCAYVHTFLGRR